MWITLEFALRLGYNRHFSSVPCRFHDVQDQSQTIDMHQSCIDRLGQPQALRWYPRGPHISNDISMLQCCHLDDTAEADTSSHTCF